MEEGNNNSGRYSAEIQKKFDSEKQFFDELKALGITVRRDVRAVIQRTIGLELAFLRKEALVKFMDRVPQAWKAETKHVEREEVLVTISPRTGSGHAYIADSVVTAALQRHGEVIKGRRCVYPEYPEVENGRRQFLMKLKSPIGSLLRFGITSFSVAHKGQVRTCYKCGENGHEAWGCKKEVCYRCGEMGHQLVNCTGDAQCVSCGEKGHIHTFCKKSFANKVKLGYMWEVVTKEDVTDEELMQGVGEEERDEQVGDGTASGNEGGQATGERQGCVQKGIEDSIKEIRAEEQGQKKGGDNSNIVNHHPQEMNNKVGNKEGETQSQDYFISQLDIGEESEQSTGRNSLDSSGSSSEGSRLTDSTPSSPESIKSQNTCKTGNTGLNYMASTMTTRAKKTDTIDKPRKSKRGGRGKK